MENTNNIIGPLGRKQPQDLIYMVLFLHMIHTYTCRPHSSDQDSAKPETRLACMFSRRYSDDWQKSDPIYTYDQDIDPDFTEPRVIPYKDLSNPTLAPPKITYLGHEVIKIVFEKDLGHGLFMRESRLYPYGEIRTKWRLFLMKFILEQ